VFRKYSRRLTVQEEYDESDIRKCEEARGSGHRLFCRNRFVSPVAKFLSISNKLKFGNGLYIGVEGRSTSEI
jgi:hypothetical protein